MKHIKRGKSSKSKAAGQSKRLSGGKMARSQSGPAKVSREELNQWYKVRKLPITLRLDADVLAWFKKKGAGYQTRINQALRRVMAREV
jgi:uncharacterized protein (DUF4415 family)